MITRLGRHVTLATLAAILAATLATRAASAEPLPAMVSLLDEPGTTDPGDEDITPPSRVRVADVTPRNQLRLELGIAGPGGLMALRYSRVLSTDTRIEPAVGIGYTGMLGSLLVTQPFFQRIRRWPDHAPMFSSLEVYLGYSVTHRSVESADPAPSIPNGTYHWIDFGLSVQNRWHGVVFMMGGGVSKLMSAPAGLGGAPDEQNDDLSFPLPEEWLARKGYAPSLWSSIGYAF